MNDTSYDLEIRRWRLWKIASMALPLVFLLLTAGRGICGKTGFTEYRLKALFLFNFAKYVEWPDQTFADTNAPITIGVVGRDDFGADLSREVADKTVGGRTFVIRHLSAKDNPQGCQILFISDSESSHIREILDRTAKLPILTVGEDKAFWENGGMIVFAVKNENVRFNVNLTPANKAGLKISSKLLSVADEIKGRPNSP